jgi:hypothetical protein
MTADSDKDEGITTGVSFPFDISTHIVELPDCLLLLLTRKDGDREIPVGQIQMSYPLLSSNEKANLWLRRTREIFFKECTGIIFNGLAVLLATASNLAALEAGIGLLDKKGILQVELDFLESFARERLTLAEKGRSSKWTTDALTKAIYAAMLEIDYPSCRTYEIVATKLRAKHPDRAPKNGESLRKTVKLLEVDWKRLKRVALKRSFKE